MKSLQHLFLLVLSLLVCAVFVCGQNSDEEQLPPPSRTARAPGSTPVSTEVGNPVAPTRSSEQQLVTLTDTSKVETQTSAQPAPPSASSPKQTATSNSFQCGPECYIPIAAGGAILLLVSIVVAIWLGRRRNKPRTQRAGPLPLPPGAEDPFLRSMGNQNKGTLPPVPAASAPQYQQAPSAGWSSPQQTFVTGQPQPGAYPQMANVYAPTGSGYGQYQQAQYPPSTQQQYFLYPVGQMQPAPIPPPSVTTEDVLKNPAAYEGASEATVEYLARQRQAPTNVYPRQQTPGASGGAPPDGQNVNRTIQHTPPPALMSEEARARIENWVPEPIVVTHRITEGTPRKGVMDQEWGESSEVTRTPTKEGPIESPKEAKSEEGSK